MTSFLDSSRLYISTVQSSPALPMQHFRPTLALKPLIPFPPTLQLLLLHPHHRVMLVAVSFNLLLPIPPLTPSGFFNGMLEVSELEALNFYIIFRLIPLTLFVSRNLTLTHFPLFGYLDSLLCDLIAPIPGLAFSLPILCTLVAASSFSTSRVHPSRNFLPTLFLRLTPTLIL